MACFVSFVFVFLPVLPGRNRMDEKKVFVLFLMRFVCADASSVWKNVKGYMTIIETVGYLIIYIQLQSQSN